jgi:hypothetical protein
MKTCKVCGGQHADDVSICPYRNKPLAPIATPPKLPCPAPRPDTAHEVAPDETKRPPTIKTFHLKLTEGEKGPFTMSQLRSMWDSGAITADTLYRADASQGWQSLAEEFAKPTTPTAPPPLASTAAPEGQPLIKIAGVFLLLAGLGVLAYFLVVFDTSIAVPSWVTAILGPTMGSDRVHNVGLMQNRQNGVIIGSVISAAGLACFLFGFTAAAERSARIKMSTLFVILIVLGLVGGAAWYIYEQMDYINQLQQNRK